MSTSQTKTIYVNPVKHSRQTKESSYHCKDCDRYYASNKSYGNHLRWYHNGSTEKPTCPKCGNTFTRHDTLKQHIKVFHNEGNQKYSCPKCKETFHNYKYYAKHTPCEVKQNEMSMNSEIRKEIVKASSSVNSSRQSNKFHLPDCDCKYCIQRKYTSAQSTNANSSKTSFRFHPYKIPEYYDGVTFSTKQILNKHLKDSSFEEFKVSKGSMECGEKKTQSKGKLHIDEDDKALDCASCNITFLSKHDYESHHPFCQSFGSSMKQ